MMKKTLHVTLAVLALCFAVNAHANHIEIKPFDTASMEAIHAQYKGRPFVLSFWATTCDPCRKEMGLWRALKLRYPAMPIVLVATDGPADQAAVTAFLMRYNPGPVQHWIFADEFTERLRYTVDKSWRGEMPRTYFFDAAHAAEAHSGLLERRPVEQWFVRHSGRAR